ncbi:hypothetical protein M408DRAFT_136866 [Serendipita vermifera MAFF 305830]|uniref:Uncharacterized protein n=1 Tax=Serendipita vermifera MAFF 305830 TaxID=933852 RepID=A0A0C2WQX5_SERVB|nr:hypothetical protein M408DRAFT_136866 [Serendipita vermifera MAFF 305830]
MMLNPSAQEKNMLLSSVSVSFIPTVFFYIPGTADSCSVHFQGLYPPSTSIHHLPPPSSYNFFLFLTSHCWIPSFIHISYSLLILCWIW